MAEGALYRTTWRWHFYAGLLVVPMILILVLPRLPGVAQWLGARRAA